ncbi:hypothetical protein SAMN02745199_0662 [Thermosipho atlanticus DSM 15807]|uniref:Uncharacterized protein n=1 Tax=Thermosipho atlanticus DSM 15807 TaxID=1123380 RepID=A0A1M5RWQ1_9BACT|nr:hypothetical protein SAMN02745199_0662 [Thermosipho atlanticus DSM 15807]
MRKNDLKFFIFIFSLLIYTLLSKILSVYLITLGRFYLSYFFIYFLLLSLFASVKGKIFLFDEIYRFWVYAFAPILVYIFFNLNVITPFYISGNFAYFICFLFSNFYNSNFKERKFIILFRTLGFFFFILGVSLNWKIF